MPGEAARKRFFPKSWSHLAVFDRTTRTRHLPQPRFLRGNEPVAIRSRRNVLKNCSPRPGFPGRMSIYDLCPEKRTSLNSLTLAKSFGESGATQCFNKSSAGARTGRSWLSARARRLSRRSSASFHRSRPAQSLRRSRPRSRLPRFPLVGSRRQPQVSELRQTPPAKEFQQPSPPAQAIPATRRIKSGIERTESCQG